MNRFFRSALFPLIIIAALVWLALQTLGSHGTKTTQATTSRVYTLIREGQVNGQGVTVDPNKQSLTLTTRAGVKYSVHYASPQAEAQLEETMVSHGVAFNSKGVGGSPWWSILTSLLPFVLLFGFWIFLMNQVQGGGSKVMSFGKSRAKRMTPDAPKIGFKD
ncbi:MAG: ATP-dependent zinc metalloprotease FtsH, partial [Gaiellaceae bacterium]